MAQSRKKAILAQVEKQRRRNKLISFSAIGVIAVIVVAVVIALPRGGNAVPLPGYLDQCITGSLVYHAHIGLTITINGTGVTIPSGTGLNGACFRPMHTHDATGVIHVEPDTSQDFKLGDFFLIWGNWANNPQTAIFNSTQIFGSHTGGGHTLTMSLNGSANTSFQNYVIPRNAQTTQGGTSSTCSSTPCQEVDIVITYQ